MMLDVNTNGYTMIHMPKHHARNKRGFVREHRIIAEAKLGRTLKDEEVVHHINHDKKDNRIANLMVFSNQKEHIKFENKIRRHGLTNPMKKQMVERWNI